MQKKFNQKMICDFLSDSISTQTFRLRKKISYQISETNYITQISMGAFAGTPIATWFTNIVEAEE